MALNLAYFMGALEMLDVLFSKEIDDIDLYHRYVLDLCEADAPQMPMDDVEFYVIRRLSLPLREWVAEFYVQRQTMS